MPYFNKHSIWQERLRRLFRHSSKVEPILFDIERQIKYAPSQFTVHVLDKQFEVLKKHLLNTYDASNDKIMVDKYTITKYTKGIK